MSDERKQETIFSQIKPTKTLIHGTILWTTIKRHKFTYELIVLDNSRSKIFYLENKFSRPEEHQNFRLWTSVKITLNPPEESTPPASFSLQRKIQELVDQGQFHSPPREICTIHPIDNGFQSGVLHINGVIKIRDGGQYTTDRAVEITEHNPCIPEPNYPTTIKFRATTEQMRLPIGTPVTFKTHIAPPNDARLAKTGVMFSQVTDLAPRPEEDHCLAERMRGIAPPSLTNDLLSDTPNTILLGG